MLNTNNSVRLSTEQNNKVLILIFFFSFFDKTTDIIQIVFKHDIHNRFFLKFLVEYFNFDETKTSVLNNSRLSHKRKFQNE